MSPKVEPLPCPHCGDNIDPLFDVEGMYDRWDQLMQLSCPFCEQLCSVLKVENGYTLVEL